MVEELKASDQSEAQLPHYMTLSDALALAQFEDTKPHVQLISEKDDVRVVLFSFKAGQRLRDHHTSHCIIVQSVQGDLVFSTSDCTARLRPGMVLQLDAHVVHGVVAQTDAIMLLMML
ncbi:hypothetical protein KDA_54010 [Dictyobacter alpinus]|uniref:Cupin 2 conserved barrel domain-containing protein n=2 Tax=Dictyobacter alpinus TaxID=2014873 RepID=A0A402BF89_9CHLR|nr:hypothetical protein KDA_54010 [Dictyobacter alpinus]